MKTRVLCAGLLCTALAASGLVADDVKDGKKAPAAKKGAAGMPSEEEMMKMWAAVATPGEATKKLEPTVGTFEAKVTSWMAPGKPPEETIGTSETKWVLGNRFVEQRVDGTMMGQPFNGIGYTGYDNYKKKYVGTWMDSMSTAIMMMEGTMTGNTMSGQGKMDDFVTKKTVTITSKTTIVDNDHHTYEMWGPAPDGKNFKMLEIHYTRKQ